MKEKKNDLMNKKKKRVKARGIKEIKKKHRNEWIINEGGGGMKEMNS